jgi:hypothetical protein
MPSIEVVDSGHVDRSDSAFPTAVRLDNGDLVCGYSMGGGAHVSGGTHCSRSTDDGHTWSYQGAILEATTEPLFTNHLRLSLTGNGTILAYGQRDHKQESDGKLVRRECEPVVCRSTDGGRSWSAPQLIPFQMPGPYEISDSIVVTDDGRWLAPAGTFHNGRYGERVVLHESADQGATWTTMHTVFEDAEAKVGYLEQKVTEYQPGRLLATAWIQDYEADTDLKNRYSFSDDGGRTWDGPHSTGIQGQTMTPIGLGDDRFLVLYNRRFGEQSVQMCLVRAAGATWETEFEGTMYDGRSQLELTAAVSSQEQIGLIRFGYPTAVRLDGETFLATHWCEEEGKCGIRWTRLRVS